MANRKEAKEWARAHMKGLFTSPTIPFTEDLRLDEAGIRSNVEHMLKCKSTGLGFGFTEPWVMTLAERKRAMEVAVDAVKKRVPAYLHATDHSIAETVNLINHAKSVGAEAVMVWTPYEWARSQKMAYDYYEYVGSKCDLAIIAYNTFHSGIALTPETIAKMAKNIPNICAIKQALNDPAHSTRCFELCGDQVVVSDPFEEHLIDMIEKNGQQLLLGTTSVFLMQSPHLQPIQEYFDLAHAGKFTEARRKYQELQPLRDVWVDMYRVLWEGGEKGVTHPLPYIKYWMDLNGMVGGRMRPPMENLNDAEKAAFKTKLMASGWFEKLFPKK